MDVSVHEAKTHLSRLLQRVALGEEVTITKAGKPVARLIPANPRTQRRHLGWAAGEFAIPEDFDAPLPAEVEESFYR